MTQQERKMNSINKELEKLTNGLTKKIEQVEKKSAKCEKMGCLNWTADDANASKDVKAYEAWFSLEIAKDDVKDLESRIENAQKRLAKITAQVLNIKEDEAEADRIRKIETMSREQFIAECAKDGIKIEVMTNNYLTGLTKSGKRFSIEGNSGWTDRSRHCYSLRIDGKGIFTSGDFATCYTVIKR